MTKETLKNNHFFNCNSTVWFIKCHTRYVINSAWVQSITGLGFNGISIKINKEKLNERRNIFKNAFIKGLLSQGDHGLIHNVLIVGPYQKRGILENQNQNLHCIKNEVFH